MVTAGSDELSAVGAPTSDFDGDGHGDVVLGVPGEDVSGAIDAGAITVVYGSGSGVNRSHSQSLSQAGSVAGAAEAGDQFGRAFGVGDINRDGRSDIVVGSPNEAMDGVVAAGSVTVLFGSESGLAKTGTQEIHQGSTISGQLETGDRFGSAIAVGDFDGDGYADAAIGAPGEDIASAVDAGVVHVVYGASAGLVSANNSSFSQANAIPGSAETDDRFGSAIAVGDFDDDGYDDIAIGAPGEDINGKIDAGNISVLYGSSAGIGTTRSKTFSQAGKVKGRPEGDDFFGSALAAGDFDGDGRDDLAIGVPGEDLSAGDDAGSINVLYGSTNGLRKSGNRSFSQKGSVNGSPQAGDRFGAALAAGDFDKNRRDDLAIGVPGEDVGGRNNAGLVNVLYGTRNGLSAENDYSFSQRGKIAGNPEAHDLLGSSVQAVDLDGDGFDDLVAGAPGEDLNDAADAGFANIVYGSRSGLRAKNNEALSQNGNVAGIAEPGDGLGAQSVETWLDRVNLYRRQAGLDPVAESSSLSSDAVRHSKYMVINGVVSHSENSGNPGYSSAGNASAGRSNVYGTTLWTTTDVAAVDGWVTGPFHAVGFLTPNLVEVGFGSYRNANASYIRMAATLDIWGGQRDWSKTPDTAYAWPGDGSVVPVRRHINEWPSPTSHCPGHQGLPVIAFFEQAVDVQDVSFTHNGSTLSHCSFDGTTYANGDGSARSLARSILNGANAVVVMPEAPLAPGESYCFSVDSGNETVSSCFTVDANA